MKPRIGILFLAVAGILFSVFMIYYGTKTPPPPIIIFEPPKSPYSHYVAAEGIIESVYKNINIGAPLGDIVTDVYVKVGDVVKKGAPLFTTDTRQYESQLAQQLEQLRLADIEYENQKVQFSFYDKLCDKAAVSQEAYAKALYSLKLAREGVEVAKAAAMVTATYIERATVRAPLDGEILQLNVRIGQYAIANGDFINQQPFIIFGDTHCHHLRIDINEEDAWRIKPGSQGMAYVRGNAKIAIPIQFVYLEPYVTPKKSFTGDDQERIDTRVLQVVYSFAKDAYPVYYGQLLDVYLEALPSEGNQ